MPRVDAVENDAMVDDDAVEARPFVWAGGFTLPRKHPTALSSSSSSYVAREGSMTTLAASINTATAVRVFAPTHRVAHRRAGQVVALASRPGTPANLGVARTHGPLGAVKSHTHVGSRGARVLARAENDGRGKNPNEELYGGGPTFSGEMIGVALFLIIALQFFGTGFMG